MEGTLVCLLDTVDRDTAISEDEITQWSTTEPKLLVGGDALSDVRFVKAINDALAKKGLSARFATESEARIIGGKLNENDVKFGKNYFGWFRTLDRAGQLINDIASILTSGRLGDDRLGFFNVDVGRWNVDYYPRNRDVNGGLVLVVSKIQ